MASQGNFIQSAPPHAQRVWMRRLVATLVSQGVRHFVVSPGSRSTPVLLAILAEIQEAHRTEESTAGAPSIHTILDERAAAFFALGLARVEMPHGTLVALLCTSGSAGGHYLPAVMEASASHIPLVVLTADRPPALHGSGANQTIDQQRLYGTHARHFLDVGLAQDDESAQLAMTRRVLQATYAARAPIPGPVHINIPAEKPLEGTAPRPPELPPRLYAPRSVAAPEAIQDVAQAIAKAKRPLVVAGPGPLSQQALRPLVRDLCARLGAPLLADLTSQLDGLPFQAEAAAHWDADLLLQIGTPPIDTGWLRWARQRPRFVFAEHGFADPNSDASGWIRGCLSSSIQTLLESLAVVESQPNAPPAPWREMAPWRETLASVVNTTTNDDAIDHARLAHAVTKSLPDEGLLFAGNSLAVRHLDLFGVRSGMAGVLHQRGISGIDGLVAGAVGATCGHWTRATNAPSEPAFKRPVLLLLGDVSLRHDLTSLALTPEAPLVVVVANDGGGRIFERLPIHGAIEPEAFEQHFATAHDFDFASAARTFGVRYAQPQTITALRTALVEGLHYAGTTLIEVRLAPSAGEDTRRALSAAIAKMDPAHNDPLQPNREGKP